MPTDGSVILQWTILSESNNYGFEVERSLTSEWEKISFVKGNGTSAKPNTYQFIDKIKKNENNISSIQYRLKQIDFDGTYAYSNVITVQITKPAKIKLFQNCPNPCNPETTISFSVPEANNISLNIYNVLGENVEPIVEEFLFAGHYNYKWQAQNLPSGIYYYTLKAGSFSETKKMVLIR